MAAAKDRGTIARAEEIENVETAAALEPETAGARVAPNESRAASAEKL